MSSNFPVEKYIHDMKNSEELVVVINVNSLENDTNLYSSDSDVVKRVIDRSSREKFRRRRELEKIHQRDCLYLVTMVLIMVTIACVVISARILIEGIPEDKPRVPPYKSNKNTTEQKYDYVVDWNVDFPEAKAVERKISVQKS